MADEDLITLKEARDKLRISRMTLHRYITAGKLSVVRLSQRKVYVRKEELERFLRESEK
jgi:excisionase family DNA binding protein